MKNRGFDLRLWFAIGSFGTIAVICMLSAWWGSNFLTRSLLERESEISQEFLEGIVSGDSTEMFHDDGSEPFVPSKALLDFAQHVVSMPGMVRVNIHAPSHRVLWSTEKEFIGRKFDVNDELDDAFRGKRVTEFETMPDDKPEHVGLGPPGDFIEAYIPVRADGGRGPILAVVEFYKLPLALQRTIDTGRRTVWIGAALAAIVLFLCLYWIVQRGARLIERQQEHLAQMEAFAAIGQMSSAVAHSLRNPMSAIRSSAELWRSEQPGGKDQVAEDVIREVDKMDGYVRDLLAYARSEPYQLQPVDPLKVINTILAKQRAVIERSQIDVETADSRAAPKKVMADEMLLEQALTSVATNAIEAMPNGGRLALLIAPGPGKDDVRIEVADTGRGIPKHLLRRVTESYFTTKARGLGLGLVLATIIIERFQGKLEIASVPDVGTKVFINLKCA